MTDKVRYPYKNTILEMLGAYFHNFWPEFYGTWEGTVKVIISESSGSDLKQLSKEIRTLLEKGFNETKLRKVVSRELGVNIYPAGFGMTYQSWLELVTELFEEGLKEKEED